MHVKFLAHLNYTASIAFGRKISFLTVANAQQQSQCESPCVVTICPSIVTLHCWCGVKCHYCHIALLVWDQVSLLSHGTVFVLAFFFAYVCVMVVSHVCLRVLPRVCTRVITHICPSGVTCLCILSHKCLWHMSALVMSPVYICIAQVTLAYTDNWIW